MRSSEQVVMFAETQDWDGVCRRAVLAWAVREWNLGPETVTRIKTFLDKTLQF